MPPKVKICGVKSLDILNTAVECGAGFIGFVFYPESPRAVTAVQAADFARHIPMGVNAVGVFVDPDDFLLEHVTQQVPLDYIQLHGSETPERTYEIQRNYGISIIKAIAVSEKKDLMLSKPYEGLADIVLFDAKPPENVVATLPGGMGISFDWDILSETEISAPWMLAGGLNVDNVVEAVETTHAQMLDVSSGVEVAPGRKDAELIKGFLAEVART